MTPASGRMIWTGQVAFKGCPATESGFGRPFHLAAVFIPRATLEPCSQATDCQPFQRLTCKAPGLTMLVGVPLMKLTTLSKAEPKYIS